MSQKRVVEIYSAGCSVCLELIDLVNRIACSDCEVTVRDMKDLAVSDHAKQLGIRSVPAIVIDGKIADCCKSEEKTEAILRSLGIGQSLKA